MKTVYKFSKINMACILVCCLLPLSGCKKFIEVDAPVTSVNEGNIYMEDATAAASLTGIYAKMANASFSLNMTVYPELSADNLTLFNFNKISYTKYYQNNLVANDPSDIPKFWLLIYPYVFNTNSAITGLNESKTLTSTVKQNLLGEAYFLRAFYYFYLVNLYGDVPLALSKDYTVNITLSRQPIIQVYAQIISDLKQAESLLTDNYMKADGLTVYNAGQEERVRPNRSAATALLARVYLYQKDWANAEKAASEVISKSEQFTPVPLSQAFLKNTKETIWALQPVRANFNTDEADLFTLRVGGPSSNGSRLIYLSDDFMKHFEIGDQRLNRWTATQTVGTMQYPYAAKYKNIPPSSLIQEYNVVLRITEQYLIRAEARIQQDNIAGGLADLNKIRDRAIDKSEPDDNKRLKLLPTSLSKDAAVKALSYERRVEFFCEWGHRWFDLKRTSQLDVVMNNYNLQKGGGDWKPFKALWPIPSTEILYNTNLVQNIGYTN